MRRTEALEFAKILQAWGEGKPVQARALGTENEWYDIAGEEYRFNSDRKYRLKPEPFRCAVVLDEHGEIVAVDTTRYVTYGPGQRVINMVEEEQK